MEFPEPQLGRFPTLVPISNSELSTFKDCRRKWYLGYYLGFGPKSVKPTGPLILGTRVHNALESYYVTGEDPVIRYVRDLAIERELLPYDADMKEFESEGELGRIMLEGYLEWLEETGADADYETIGAEQMLSVPLFDGRVQLQGKLDMRVRRRTDGVRLVMDHKTLASFPSITSTAHMSEQGMMYQLLENLNGTPEQERCDGFIYNMLRKVKRSDKAKPPFYDRLEVHFNVHSIRSFWMRLHGTISDMLEVRRQLDEGMDPRAVVYPRPTQDCTWKCPFFHACPMMDDGSAVEEYVDAFFEQHDPYQRYQDGSDRTDGS